MDEQGSVERTLEAYVARFAEAPFEIIEARGWAGFKTLEAHETGSVLSHRSGAVESRHESYTLSYWNDHSRSTSAPFLTVTTNHPGAASVAAARASLVVVDGRVSTPAPDERGTVDRVAKTTVAGNSVSFYVAERMGFFAACGMAGSIGVTIAGRGVAFDRISLGYVRNLNEYVDGFRTLTP